MHPQRAAADGVLGHDDALAQRLGDQLEEARQVVELQLVWPVVRRWAVGERVADEQHSLGFRGGGDGGGGGEWFSWSVQQ